VWHCIGLFTFNTAKCRIIYIMPTHGGDRVVIGDVANDAANIGQRAGAPDDSQLL